MEINDTIYRLFQQSSGVCTDTRKMKKNALFFALSGENFNGNRFAAEALEKGAVAAVVDDKNFIPENDSRYFLVKNVLETLQNLAKHHRKQFNIPVLAITGTNGKTTTKELCAAVLSSGKNITFTQGNLNNHIGVPLTLLNINSRTEMAVVEMGANHPGEIARLCDIALPTQGLITNIGKAHLEGFGNFQGVINTKNELYRFIKKQNGTVLVNKDNPLLMQLSDGIKRYTYGSPPADVQGFPKKNDTFLTVVWLKNNHPEEIRSRLYGSYNFDNIMAAIATGTFFGIPEKKIVQAIEQYQPQNNRSQWMTTQTNVVILDAYNANPESMALAIDDFKAHHFDNPVVILGDMFELGTAAGEEHQKILKKLEETGFKNVILAGKEFYKAAAGSRFLSFKTTDEAAAYLKTRPVKNAHVLVKGSRGMQLEKIIQYL